MFSTLSVDLQKFIIVAVFLICRNLQNGRSRAGGRFLECYCLRLKLYSTDYSHYWVLYQIFNMIESLMLDAICYEEIITFTNRFGTTEFRQLPHGRWPLLKTELNIMRTPGYKVKLCKHVKLYSGEQRFIAWKFCLRYKCKLHIG